MEPRIIGKYNAANRNFSRNPKTHQSISWNLIGGRMGIPKMKKEPQNRLSSFVTGICVTPFKSLRLILKTIIPFLKYQSFHAVWKAISTSMMAKKNNIM
jgi:hypothetical protein